MFGFTYEILHFQCLHKCETELTTMYHEKNITAIFIYLFKIEIVQKVHRQTITATESEENHSCKT